MTLRPLQRRASTWDSMYALGNATLDKAVTVKLTRTLAIIPITLALAVFRTYKAEEEGGGQVSIKQVFPFFILFFIGASIITTIAAAVGVPMEVVRSAQGIVQVLYYHGNGSHRAAYEYYQAC